MFGKPAEGGRGEGTMFVFVAVSVCIVCFSTLDGMGVGTPGDG